jgi:hypothetical protein
MQNTTRKEGREREKEFWMGWKWQSSWKLGCEVNSLIATEGSFSYFVPNRDTLQVDLFLSRKVFKVNSQLPFHRLIRALPSFLHVTVRNLRM